MRVLIFILLWFFVCGFCTNLQDVSDHLTEWKKTCNVGELFFANYNSLENPNEMYICQGKGEAMNIAEFDKLQVLCDKVAEGKYKQGFEDGFRIGREVKQ